MFEKSVFSNWESASKAGWHPKAGRLPVHKFAFSGHFIKLVHPSQKDNKVLGADSHLLKTQFFSHLSWFS